ncbi:MAG: sulfatase-like hydrolase/transferase, partial [Phycisphaeraceae bacterium]|nr:sulfatase-like hydrolase/transferase [Phycisphaeraceae bacterium]
MIPTLSFADTASAHPVRPPNIVFVFADQMPAHVMGCAGTQQVKTPHLDRLAGEGLRLEHMISSQPVCTPYRGQLMTGQYGHTSGVTENDKRLPDDQMLLPEYLQQAGYHTGYIGKWHLAGYRDDPIDATNRRGWDDWAVQNCSHQHFEARYWVNDAEEPVVADRWEPDVQTDLAVEYIERNREHPFCLML